MEHRSDPAFGSSLALELKLDHPHLDLYSLLEYFGVTVDYEQPPADESYLKRISEYRPKSKKIVIFHRERETEAIAHELFHHLERLHSYSFSSKESEEHAAAFAKEMIYLFN